MASSSTQSVKRAFDYSKFDNIDVSDDESTFHPNIEKNFNVKINRTVRDRKIGETEAEISELKKQLDAQNGGSEKGKKIEKRIEELERKRIWHAGNMCDVKAEKTVVTGYGGRNPKDLVPGKEEGLTSDKDVEAYMTFKEENDKLLETFVSVAGDFERSRKLLVTDGEKLVDSTHTSTYLLLACLEHEMAGDRKKSYKCAQQSQCLAHIRELAIGLNRPPRDLVHKWFDAIGNEDRPEAYNTWKTDVDQFQERVQGRAIEKKKEEAEQKRKEREFQESYVARREEKRKDREERKERGEEVSEDEEEEEEHDDEAKKMVYRRAEELEEDDDVRGEAVPLVQAMKEMTKDERMAMAPGGLDPLEVFESLPAEMKHCFESQDVGALVELQKTMPADVFNPALVRCMKAGLWSQPMGDEEEEEAEAPGDVPEPDLD